MTISRKLSRAHFAFMRALAQGLDLRASWVQYGVIVLFMQIDTLDVHFFQKINNLHKALPQRSPPSASACPASNISTKAHQSA